MTEMMEKRRHRVVRTSGLVNSHYDERQREKQVQDHVGVCLTLSGPVCLSVSVSVDLVVALSDVFYTEPRPAQAYRTISQI